MVEIVVFVVEVVNSEIRERLYRFGMFGVEGGFLN